MCHLLVADAAEETLKVDVVIVDGALTAGEGLEEAVEALPAPMVTAALLPKRTRQTRLLTGLRARLHKPKSSVPGIIRSQKPRTPLTPAGSIQPMTTQRLLKVSGEIPTPLTTRRLLHQKRRRAVSFQMGQEAGPVCSPSPFRYHRLQKHLRYHRIQIMWKNLLSINRQMQSLLLGPAFHLRPRVSNPLSSKTSCQRTLEQCLPSRQLTSRPRRMNLRRATLSKCQIFLGTRQQLLLQAPSIALKILGVSYQLRSHHPSSNLSHAHQWVGMQQALIKRLLCRAVVLATSDASWSSKRRSSCPETMPLTVLLFNLEVSA